MAGKDGSTMSCAGTDDVVVVVLQCPVAGRNALPGYGLSGGLGEVSGRSADGLKGGRGSRTELKNGAIGFSTGW